MKVLLELLDCVSRQSTFFQFRSTFSRHDTDVLPPRHEITRLVHALPVKHGLYRRTAKDRSRVVNFFDVEDLDAATATLNATCASGNRILYHDGGAAVAATLTS